MMNRALWSLMMVLVFCGAAHAENPEVWLRRWNAEPGRERPLKAEDVRFHDADKGLFPSLTSVGFRQSDGRFTLGRLIWKGEALSPLQGIGRILQDHSFAELNDQERLDLFLTVLAQTYATMGVYPYEGKAGQREDRPAPVTGQRATDQSHRFLVWYSLLPSGRESTEWRRVLYFVSADGSKVKARTLRTYHPEVENLTGFPSMP